MIPEASPSQEMCFFFLIWFQTTVFQTHFYLVKKWYWTTVNLLLLFCSKSRDFILSHPHVFIRRSRLFFILQIRKLRHRMKSLNYFLMELEALPGLRLAFTWPITYHSSIIGRYPSLTPATLLVNNTWAFFRFCLHNDKLFWVSGCVVTRSKTIFSLSSIYHSPQCLMKTDSTPWAQGKKRSTLVISLGGQVSKGVKTSKNRDLSRQEQFQWEKGGGHHKKNPDTPFKRFPAGEYLGRKVAAVVAAEGQILPATFSQSHFFKAPRLFRASWAWDSCCCSLWRVLSLEARFRRPCISSTTARWPGVLWKSRTARSPQEARNRPVMSKDKSVIHSPWTCSKHSSFSPRRVL